MHEEILSSPCRYLRKYETTAYAIETIKYRTGNDKARAQLE